MSKRFCADAAAVVALAIALPMIAIGPRNMWDLVHIIVSATFSTR